MDFLIIVLPLILLVSFVLSKYLINNAERKLKNEFIDNLYKNKIRESKKTIFVMLMVSFFLLLKNSLERLFNFENIQIIIFIILFFVFALYLFYSKFNLYKNQNFPQFFLNAIIKSEVIKIAGIIFVFVFLFFSIIIEALKNA